MYRCCLQQYSKQIDEGRSIISLSEEEIMTDELENLILIYMLLKTNEKRTEGISGTKFGLITKQALLVISDFLWNLIVLRGRSHFQIYAIQNYLIQSESVPPTQ